jgi:hypothetical protein
MSRRRRYGRDSLTGGHKTSLLAAVAGFLIVPTGVGMATTMLASQKFASDPQKLATVYTGAHALGALACWQGAKRYPAAHSFLKGGMLGEGITAAVAGVETAMIAKAGTSTQAALPAGSSSQTLMALGDKLVKGGWFR